MLVARPGYADVYRWLDAAGEIHFGDRPPDKQAEKVSIQRAPTPPPGAGQAGRLQQQQKLLNAYREERLKKEDDERRLAEQQEKQQRACMEAQDQLRQFERSGALYDLDEQGRRIYKGEAEREAFIENFRQQVRRYCD